MEKRNLKNEDVKRFFTKLIKNKKLDKNSRWADDLPYLNGTDGRIRCLPYNILFTKETSDIFKENRCFWFIRITTKTILCPYRRRSFD